MKASAWALPQRAGCQSCALPLSGTSLARLVESSGVALEKRGADLVGRCPFHDDRTPSLVVTPAKNLWRCFGAWDAGGDPIAWVIRREGVSFRHAVELLRGDYVPGERAEAVTRSTVAKLPVLSAAEDGKLMGEVADYYTRALRTNPEALAYLAKRGLAHPGLAPVKWRGICSA